MVIWTTREPPYAAFCNLLGVGLLDRVGLLWGRGNHGIEIRGMPNKKKELKGPEKGLLSYESDGCGHLQPVTLVQARTA